MTALTTRQIEQRALTIPCPEHHVPAGQRCPIRPGGVFGDACYDRRQAAEAVTASA